MRKPVLLNPVEYHMLLEVAKRNHQKPEAFLASLSIGSMKQPYKQQVVARSNQRLTSSRHGSLLKSAKKEGLPCSTHKKCRPLQHGFTTGSDAFTTPVAAVSKGPTKAGGGHGAARNRSSCCPLTQKLPEWGLADCTNSTSWPSQNRPRATTGSSLAHTGCAAPRALIGPSTISRCGAWATAYSSR